MDMERLRTLAPDLNRTSPRSPYSPLGEALPAVAARLVDKCRAELLGQNGDYHFNCPLDRKFFAAAGLEADPLRKYIATGANDDEVAAWIAGHSHTPIEKITSWGRRFRANPLWYLLELDDWQHRRRRGGAG
ncbi:hypothetical protein BH20VER3_BH20VER3_20600 [soil metagenome]